MQAVLPPQPFVDVQEPPVQLPPVDEVHGPELGQSDAPVAGFALRSWAETANTETPATSSAAAMAWKRRRVLMASCAEEAAG